MPRQLLIPLFLAAAAGCSAGPSDGPIMEWSDLLDREQPRPDATIAYGDDPLQVIDIWRPAGAGPAPAVVMIHGGCWQTAIAERDIMNWIADDLRTHGVGVWNLEYRGVDRGGGYPETYRNVAAAADLFREQAPDHGLDPSRVVVIGHSAGGHLALWLANRPALPTSEPLRGSDPIEVDLAICQGGLPDLRAGQGREGHPCGTEAPRLMSGPDFSVTSPQEMVPGRARQVLFNNALDPIAPPAYARDYLAAVRPKGVGATPVETQGEGHVELVAPDSESWSKQRALILREFDLE